MGLYKRTWKDKDGEVKKVKEWWASATIMGKRVRFCTGETNKDKAQSVLEEREVDARKGVQISKDAHRIKFYEIAEAVVRDYKINKLRSLEEVETRLRLHILPAFGDAICVNIKPRDIEAYKLKRKEAGAANATINRETSIIKRAFTLAIDQGILRQGPKVSRLSEAHNVRRGFPTPEQLNAVIGKIEAMPEDRYPRIVRAIIIAIAKYGWRTSEFLGNKRRKIEAMQWTQIDFAAGTISLLASKNGEARPDIPMTGQLLEVMQEMREYTDKVQREQSRETGRIEPIKWVFHRDGEKVAGINKVWKEATKQAGCPGLLLHDFRRGAVRRLTRCPGISRELAMSLTGHRTESVFKRYNIIDAADLERGADALEALEAAELESVTVLSQLDEIPAGANA